MFTSKLPVSTSVRRPTNPSDNRASNIPVTVRKANLFTPQTKRPFSIGTSTAGKSFTSGTATERKFQRSLKPAPDRDAQQRMFDNLVEFIKNNAPPGFPYPEAKKFFSSVSTTESSRIFEFLISRILPDFKINRLEVDVPEALSLLDYPFIRSVTKSSLVSVTTRQAAAGLLHIFQWLVRSINDIDISDPIEDDEPPSEQEVFFRNAILYPETVYEENKKYLMTNYSQDDPDKLDQESEFLQEEDERLQRQLQEINGLMQDEATIREDIKKCRDYEDQMQRYLQTKVDELSEIQQNRQDSKLQLEDYSREIDQLRHAVNSHELNIDQVDREQKNLSKLEQTLQAFRDQRVQAESEFRLVEGKHQRLLERSQELSSERLNQLREFSCMTSSIPYLKDFDMPQGLDTEEELRNTISRIKDFASELEPILSGRKAELVAEMRSLEVTDASYPTEVFPRLQEEIEKFERRLEVAKRSHVDSLSSHKSQMNDLERQAKQLDQEAQETIRILRAKEDLANQLLADHKQSSTHMLVSSKTHLQANLEKHKQRMLILTKEAKQQAEDWKEAELAWDNRRTVVDTAYRLLKRPLGLK